MAFSNPPGLTCQEPLFCDSSVNIRRNHCCSEECPFLVLRYCSTTLVNIYSNGTIMNQHPHFEYEVGVRPGYGEIIHHLRRVERRPLNRQHPGIAAIGPTQTVTQRQVLRLGPAYAFDVNRMAGGDHHHLDAEAVVPILIADGDIE